MSEMDARCHLCGWRISDGEEVVTMRPGVASNAGILTIDVEESEDQSDNYYAVVHYQCALNSIELHRTW